MVLPAQKDKLTHLAKHDAEDKGTGRLVPRAKERVRHDPRRRQSCVRERKQRIQTGSTHRTPTPLSTSASSSMCSTSISPHGEDELDSKTCGFFEIGLTSNTAVAGKIIQDHDQKRELDTPSLLVMSTGLRLLSVPCHCRTTADSPTTAWWIERFL